MPNFPEYFNYVLIGNVSNKSALPQHCNIKCPSWTPGSLDMEYVCILPRSRVLPSHFPLLLQSDLETIWWVFKYPQSHLLLSCFLNPKEPEKFLELWRRAKSGKLLSKGQFIIFHVGHVAFPDTAVCFLRGPIRWGSSMDTWRLPENWRTVLSATGLCHTAGLHSSPPLQPVACLERLIFANGCSLSHLREQHKPTYRLISDHILEGQHISSFSWKFLYLWPIQRELNATSLLSSALRTFALLCSIFILFYFRSWTKWYQITWICSCIFHVGYLSSYSELLNCLPQQWPTSKTTIDQKHQTFPWSLKDFCLSLYPTTAKEHLHSHS